MIERPSSIVKELLENAIDAGSHRRDSGDQTRWRLPTSASPTTAAASRREDVPTAFLRHATSKVRTEDDLATIGTLGFRGEALASICAVARVEMLTRAPDDRRWGPRDR